MWNLVVPVNFGQNCEIWSKLWNLVKILKFGRNCEIWLKLWNLVKHFVMSQRRLRKYDGNCICICICSCICICFCIWAELTQMRLKANWQVHNPETSRYFRVFNLIWSKMGTVVCFPAMGALFKLLVFSYLYLRACLSSPSVAPIVFEWLSGSAAASHWGCNCCHSTKRWTLCNARNIWRATYNVHSATYVCNVKCATQKILQKVTQIKQVLSDCTTATVSTQPRDEQRAQPRDEQCALCIVNFVAQGIAVHYRVHHSA